MVVNAFNLKAAGISGSLGYRLPGGAAVMTAIVQQAVLSWNQAFFRPRSSRRSRRSPGWS
jgi:hypothetical protein